MKFLSLSNAIKFMIAVGVIAIFAVLVQSCQSPKPPESSTLAEKNLELAQFQTGSLQRLQFLASPPDQPRERYVNWAGETMALSDFRGDYLLLNIWATWCPPCVVEMPSLNAFAGDLRGENIAVVTISMDQQDNAIAAFFAKNNLSNLTNWRDENLTIASKLGKKGLPLTIIYNPRGIEIARISGEVDWSSDEARGLINEILGKE